MSRRSSKRALPLPIRRVLSEPFDDAAIASLVARRRPVARVSRAWVLVPLSVAAALLLFFVWPETPGPLLLESGDALADAVVGEATLALDDGSRVEASEGARLAILENDAAEIAFLLEMGTVTFDVEPHGPRRWTIECGLATVVVVGTRFTLDRTEERLVVSVERGHVLVRGERVPDRVRALGAGDRFELLAREPEPPPPPALSPIEAPEVTEPVEPARAVPAAPTWRALADARRWDDAYRELSPSDVARITERGTVDELLALADVARLSGHPEGAIEPLTRVSVEHARDPNASLAAFSLGRIEDQLGHPERAAAAFERALTLGLPDALAGDALARRAAALLAAGDHARARDAARRYLERFPDGPRTSDMEAIGATP